MVFYLIGQAKIGISSLELCRHLGVNNDTAWLLYNRAIELRQNHIAILGYMFKVLGRLAGQHLVML